MFSSLIYITMGFRCIDHNPQMLGGIAWGLVSILNYCTSVPWEVGLCTPLGDMYVFFGTVYCFFGGMYVFFMFLKILGL